MKVFLIAHAGGNVWDYKKLFSSIFSVDFIPVELPGNASRLAENVLGSLEAYAQMACDFIESQTTNEEKVTIFGHSFGGYLMYEIAKRLNRPLERVFISCAVPFHLVSDYEEEDEDLIEQFGYRKQYNNIIFRLFKPIVTKKIDLVKQYQQKMENPKRVECIPVRAVIIYAQKDVSQYDYKQWGRYFREEGCHFYEFNGGHFYWNETETMRNRLVTIVKSELNLSGE